MKRCVWAVLMLAALMAVAADRDATLRAAQDLEKGGKTAEAAKAYASVEGDAAALEGIGRTGDASDAETLLAWLKGGDAHIGAG